MKTQLLIKTDKKLKEEAKKVAQEMGLPLNIIMNNYLKDFINTKRVEFQAPLVPNKKTQKILEEAEKDIREGNYKNFSPIFDNVEDAVIWLNK